MLAFSTKRTVQKLSASFLAAFIVTHRYPLSSIVCPKQLSNHLFINKLSAAAPSATRTKQFSKQATSHSDSRRLAIGENFVD
jgi:hypothetical protein